MTRIDATTAEKLEATSRGLDTDPIPFPPSSNPRLPLLLHPCFIHSFPYSSVLLLLNLARRSKKGKGSLYSITERRFLAVSLQVM